MAFDWGSAMPGFGNRIAAIGQNAYDNAEDARLKALAAEGSAETAAARLVDVQTAANGAFAAANYKGEWSTLSGALNVPATVTHLGRLWYLKLNLANVTTQAPALGSAYWGEVSRNDYIPFNAPAGNTNAIDRGFYRMTSASSVVVLPAAPWHGMVVAVVNVSDSLSPYINRNGKTICGEAANYLVNLRGAQIVLMYDANSGDWLRVNGVTAAAPYKEALLQQKVIVVNAPAVGGSASVPHGLARSQVRGLAIAAFGSGFTAGPDYGSNDSLNYSAYLDDVNCNVYLPAGKGSAVASRPVYFTIFYEA
ncbi:hypothetical protein [Comamonas sp.]|uniref:hypothetical protein n=1 Tax=Comamonas sp. TaxID=34028 RepID=UPI0028AF04DF|nr:hypothetical protein [Comamonas sp.]